MNCLSEDANLDDWRQAYRAMQLPSSPDCLSEDQMIAMTADKIQGAARLPLADHIVRCRRCTDAYQALLRLPS